MNRPPTTVENGIEIYLREIGQVPLLTPKEEIALAARIKRGDRKAREHMIKANLRLVVKIAHDYANLGLPLLDLISEGNIGLIKAVERFDPAKGAKFSTYGAWWIKQAMRRALSDKGKTIRLPVHITDKISKMKRLSYALTEKLGREPTDDELAAKLGLTRAKVQQFRSLSVPPASLNAIMGDDRDGAEFGELVGDEHAATPYETLRDKSLGAEIKVLMRTLDPRELEIITKRYGLDGSRPRTLEQIGKQFKVSRERIRQIQESALLKLRRASIKLEPPAKFSLS